MRALLTCLILLAACGDDGVTPSVDAGPETWTIEWAGGGIGSAPALTTTTTLEIAGNVLTYLGSPGGEQHIATVEAGGCFAVPEHQDADRWRRAYRLCPRGGQLTGLEAEVSWTIALNSPTLTTWRLRAFQ